MFAVAFLKRTWPLIVGVALCLALLVSQLQLRNANTKLATEQQTREVLQVELGAPTADGIALVQAARKQVVENKDRKVVLERISRETVAAKKRADASDAELKRVQAANSKRFASSHKAIRALQTRKPTGDPAKDWKTIEEDSKAAWKGWK